MEPIELLLKLAKQVLGIRSEIDKQEDERREKIANFLEEVAKTTLEVESTLREGKVPAFACSKMQTLSLELESICDNTAALDSSSRKIHYLLAELIQAYDAGMLLWDIEQVEDPETELQKLSEVAGLFAGMAVSVRAK